MKNVKVVVAYLNFYIICIGLVILAKDISKYGDDVEKFTPQEVNTLRRNIAVMSYLVFKALDGLERKCVQYILGGGKVSCFNIIKDE